VLIQWLKLGLRELMRLIVRERGEPLLLQKPSKKSQVPNLVEELGLNSLSGSNPYLLLENSLKFMAEMQPVGAHLLAGLDKLESGRNIAHSRDVQRSVASKGL
jgi:lysophospholipid acyltransferase (LPLAT)-like uncharacterized protein